MFDLRLFPIEYALMGRLNWRQFVDSTPCPKTSVKV